MSPAPAISDESRPILTAFLIAGTAGTAGAAVIVRSVTVKKSQLEQGVLGDGQYFRTSIPGWSASGSGVGYFNPPAGAGFDATDGQNVVDTDVFRHSNEVGDSTYTQVLSEVIAAGTTYELSVDAIRRPDIDIGP